ncbi:hypothetical protein [Hymenobacter canadensis]|uniref:Uncharacterized protein n=1 Tax=Hymenobacter canadensis TaxID=2999067 RepID=A0ABY7LS06_9BACT|nr:hypothetical protein [Hymenobacter canadensis]WBA42629.1 hypothetical protein O3303_03495 [Hymenobacter canadensis]
MVYFIGGIRLFYKVLLIECVVFCLNISLLFSENALDALNKSRESISIESSLFIVFYGSVIVLGLWALSELVLPREVSLVSGGMVVKRGFIVVDRISYDSISTLTFDKANIEKSRAGSLKNDTVAKGEKVQIQAHNKTVQVYSFQMNGYAVFRQKLINLSVKAKTVGARKYSDDVDYGFLFVGGLFVLAMTYIVVLK